MGSSPENIQPNSGATPEGLPLGDSYRTIQIIFCSLPPPRCSATRCGPRRPRRAATGQMDLCHLAAHQQWRLLPLLLSALAQL